MEEIYPCKYCGPNQDRVMMGTKFVLDSNGELWEGFRWYCDNCGWSMPAHITEEGADNAWNYMNREDVGLTPPTSWLDRA